MQIQLAIASKIVKLVLVISGIALIVCCNTSITDEIAPSGNGKLKRVLLYNSLDDKLPISIVEEYEYDSDGRISRMSSPMYKNGDIIGEISYDTYEYNANNQLVRKSNFNANSNAYSGFIHLKDFIYTYGINGKVERETIEYPQIGSSEFTLYMYDPDRLVRKEEYDRDSKLERYVIYEYDDGGKLVKETYFDRDNQSFGFTEHFYSSGLNTKSKVYTGSEDILLREIFRTFNNANNLLILKSNEIASMSSSMSYVLKYEYY